MNIEEQQDNFRGVTLINGTVIVGLVTFEGPETTELMYPMGFVSSAVGDGQHQARFSDLFPYSTAVLDNLTLIDVQMLGAPWEMPEALWPMYLNAVRSQHSMTHPQDVEEGAVEVDLDDSTLIPADGPAAE